MEHFDEITKFYSVGKLEWKLVREFMGDKPGNRDCSELVCKLGSICQWIYMRLKY